MAETAEQLKQRVDELRRNRTFTNERIDVLNDAAWQLRFVDTQHAARVSTEALQYAARNHYERGRGYALLTAGWCQYLTSQYGKAEQTLSESRKILNHLRDDAGIATVMNALATTKQRMGRPEQVVEDYSFALNLRKKKNDRAGASAILDNLGVFYSRLGEHSQALDYHYQALAAAIESRAYTSQIHICLNLGDLLWRVGEATRAIGYSEKALSLSKEHSYLFTEGAALVNLGEAYYSQRKYHEALDYFWRGLAILENTDSFEAQAGTLCNIGNVYVKMGDWRRAVNNFSQALQISQQIGSRHYESETLLHLGLLYQQLGDLREGAEFLNQALEISQKLEAKEILYKANLALSEVYETQNKMQAALVHHKEFHRIWSEVHGAAAASQIQRLLVRNQLSGSLFGKPFLSGRYQTEDHVALLREADALPPTQKLRQVIEFITDNPEENLAISKLADLAALSQRHFQRSFKQLTSKTPHQFVLEQRLERAKLLLETTRLPLVEVALRCGFASQSHLTSQFRLSTGKTPGQFRRPR